MCSNALSLTPQWQVHISDYRDVMFVTAILNFKWILHAAIGLMSKKDNNMVQEQQHELLFPFITQQEYLLM